MRGTGRLAAALVAAAALGTVTAPARGGPDGFVVSRATMTLVSGDGPARLEVRGRIPRDLALDFDTLSRDGFRIEVGGSVLLAVEDGGPWSVARTGRGRGDRWVFSDGQPGVGGPATVLTLDTRTRRFRLKSRVVDAAEAVGANGTSGVRFDLGGTVLEEEFSFLDRSTRRFRYRNVVLPWEWLLMGDPDVIYLWAPGIPVDIGTLVVENRMEWLAYWSGSGPPPEVDFATHLVVVISASFPSGGYRLEFEDWSEENGVYTVKVLETVPSGPCRVDSCSSGKDRILVLPRMTGDALRLHATTVRFEARLVYESCPESPRGIIVDR